MSENKYQNERDVAEELFGYSPCLHCKRLEWDNEKGNYCKAFPKGMPNEIFWGENLHKAPYPGDNGITFLSSD
jgi:hypothetical protein